MTPDGLGDIELRPAREGDITQFDRLWAEAEREDPSPDDDSLPLYAHELTTGAVWVAARGDRVVGMAAALIRGDVAVLAELAVAADVQDRGIGRRLLAAVMPADVPERFTLSSRDRRAVGLYARVGMTPRWPVYELRAEQFDLQSLDGGVEAAVAAVDDPAFIAWDARVGKRHRPQDLTFVANEVAAQPLWFRRGGATVGYGLVAQRMADEPKQSGTYALGPLGVGDPADAGACVAAALKWARPRARAVRLDVPAPHPALAPLLEAGFRIVEDDQVFCCSSAATAADLASYLPTFVEIY
ncbi:MAG: GNAT family N-acetyltransferase [Chloroflexi bacterium]|nr:GNAT family N-acetyltransferase [Chloroflexota bacterium]